MPLMGVSLGQSGIMLGWFKNGLTVLPRGVPSRMPLFSGKPLLPCCGRVEDPGGVIGKRVDGFTTWSFHQECLCSLGNP